MSADFAELRAAEALLEGPLRSLAIAYRRAVGGRLDFAEPVFPDDTPARQMLHWQRVECVDAMDRALAALLDALEDLKRLDRRLDTCPPVTPGCGEATPPHCAPLPDDMPF